MYQKLITKEVERQAAKYPIGSQDNYNLGLDGLNEATVWLKLFDPTGRYTLFVTEADLKRGLLFGYCISPLGEDCDEWGYTSLDELRTVRGRWGLGIERDMHFPATTVRQAVTQLIG